MPVSKLGSVLGLDRSTSDNYTCVVRNPWGEERAAWEVGALWPPGAPRARLAAAAHARLAVAWDAPLQPPQHHPQALHGNDNLRSEKDAGIFYGSEVMALKI